MPYFFSGDCQENSTKIGNTVYTTFSFFQSDKLMFDKIGEMIFHSYQASTAENNPELFQGGTCDADLESSAVKN